VATEAEHREAVARLVGALSYGLLRSFEVTARATARAPAVALADRQAGFAVDEFNRYRVLRARLDELTGDPDTAMRPFRPPLDAFYDHASAGGWLEAQAFHFIGDTVTADFAEMIAPHVDAETADVLRRALTGRTAQQAFAIEQIGQAMETEHDAARERIARYAGTIVSQGLNRLREALEANDALQVILGDGGVKDVVLEVLGRHRERLERIGIETLDE
jgi:hypothetical protein